MTFLLSGPLFFSTKKKSASLLHISEIHFRVRKEELYLLGYSRLSEDYRFLFSIGKESSRSIVSAVREESLGSDAGRSKEGKVWDILYTQVDARVRVSTIGGRKRRKARPGEKGHEGRERRGEEGEGEDGTTAVAAYATRVYARLRTFTRTV